MTSGPHSQKSDTSKSMIEADTANGEGPDLELPGTPRRAGTGEDTAEHLTGTRQAEENIENDPPA